MGANADVHEEHEDAGAAEEQQEDTPMEMETKNVIPMFDTVDPNDFLGSVAKVGYLTFVCMSIVFVMVMQLCSYATFFWRHRFSFRDKSWDSLSQESFCNLLVS